MKNTWCFGLLLLGLCFLGLAACVGLPASPLVVASASPAEPRAEPTVPACTTHTVALDLVADSVTPLVGDTLVVTATLRNVGCANVGLPKYTVIQASESAAPMLEPSVPISVVHYLGIGPGGQDSAAFEFDAASSGVVTLTASVSFEVHLGYPGPAYWSAAGTRPLQITVSQPEILWLPLARRE